MKTMISGVLAWLLFVALPINAFLPNRLSAIDVGRDTLTHEDITQIGILKAVAYYFEDNPKPGNPLSPGTLVDMSDISAVKLFKVYYGAEVNANGLQEVISSISTHNSQTYADLMSNAVWHMNGELIKEANKLLMSLRDDIITALTQETDRFDQAREMVGRYLHVLQMFYSNTNWVELFGSEAYYSLGIRGKPLYAQAPVTMMTCRNCGARGDKSCKGTLIDNGQVLTSGYRSGQNMEKMIRDPDVLKTGKCSHGGRFDSTSKTVAATGGINKDSTVESLSPHYYLHHQAAQAAINHTTFFFNDKVYGLRHLIDKNKFERFLQTRSGVSLVFVVDSTGSMRDDIAAVKGQIVEIIFKHLGTPREPSNYVIVLFNDPANLTTSFQTKSNQEALNYVNEINVDGGGDCPEYSMTGIETALRLCKPKSEIMIFTDASAKDYDKSSLVKDIAYQKNAKLTFLLTGMCDSRKRRGTDQGLQYIGHQRSRRSLTGIDLYKNLASSTGGSVYQTTKAGIAKLANIITEISITSPVTILKREVQPGSRDIDIQVDSTITQLTLDITGTGSLNEKIYNPAGELQKSNLTETDIGVGKLVKINSPTPGIWRLSGLTSSSWNVHITAVSTLDVSTKFVRLDPTTGFEFEIKGRPIAGAKATIILTIPSADSIDSINFIQLVDSQGSEIARYSNFSVIPGRANSSQYRTEFQLPSKQFQVAVWGNDSTGNVFTRLYTRKIVPVALALKVMEIDDSLYVNESVRIIFTITNEGDSPSRITVTIHDDKNFAKKPLHLIYDLGPKENATGTFLLVAGPSPNVLVTATITATAKTSSEDYSQFEIIRLSTKKRIKRPTDNLDPVCNITSITGSCDESMVGPCVCSQYNWTATAEIWDEGFGLYHITSSVKEFSHDSFPQGYTRKNGTVMGKVFGNCCNPNAYITVVDLASNTGQCSFNLAPAVEDVPTECIQDLIAPVCNVTSMTGICDGTMVDPCECSQYNWTATADIWDEGFGLYQITSVKSRARLTFEAFNEGQTIENGSVKATVSGSCCDELTHITVVDMANNTGKCEVNPSPGMATASTECKREPNSNKFSKSSSAIIGAVAGCVALLVVILVGAVCVVHRRRMAKITVNSRHQETSTVLEMRITGFC